MTTAQLMRLRLPAQRGDSVTTRALAALAMRRARFGAARCACRAFGMWVRDGATPLQAARVAIATLRAFA